MNKFEEIKATRDGLDVLPDIMRYADMALYRAKNAGRNRVSL